MGPRPRVPGPLITPVPAAAPATTECQQHSRCVAWALSRAADRKLLRTGLCLPGKKEDEELSSAPSPAHHMQSPSHLRSLLGASREGWGGLSAVTGAVCSPSLCPSGPQHPGSLLLGCVPQFLLWLCSGCAVGLRASPLSGLSP